MKPTILIGMVRHGRSVKVSGKMVLYTRQRRHLAHLLGCLQTHLESAIESSLVPGTNQPDPACIEDVENVAKDRVLWLQAEEWVKRLNVERSKAVDPTAPKEAKTK